LWLGAYPAAWFYGEPKLVPLLCAASLLFVPIALQAVPRALLDKRLDLKSVSRVEAVARIFGGAVVFAIVWAGAGVWSLIAGPMIVGVLRAVGFSLAAGLFLFPRFHFSRLSSIVRVGSIRMVENILWSFCDSADVFIVGTFLGAETLGIY